MDARRSPPLTTVSEMNEEAQVQMKTTVRAARQFADSLDAAGRGRLLYELVRAVYDSEKFNGVGGEGLDGRDSAARNAFARVSDAALAAQSAVSD